MIQPRLLSVSLALGVLFTGSVLAQDSRYVLSLNNVIAPVGDTVTQSSRLVDPRGEPLLGWSVTVCMNGPAAILAVDLGEAASANGRPPEFSASEIVPELGWSATVILSLDGSSTLPPSAEPLELNRSTYELLALGTVLLEYCNRLGNPTFVTALVESDGDTAIPETGSGSIEVVRLGQTDFVRGDCNANGKVDIADAIDILNALVAGYEAPCREACHASGGPILNTWDATFLLSYLFLGGFPPPSPFPACGLDAGSDCESFAACP